MNNPSLKLFLLAVASILLLTLLSGCSPFYVMRAAYEQSKILLARQDIEQLLDDQQSSAEDREKLLLVLQARDFAAKQLGLTPKDSFTKFSEVDRDVLAWVVMASKKDAFELYTWWYPIVGTVPYKGFFSKDSAIEAATELSNKDYETWVRGTEAISTLGWFNDPVLSTTLRHEPASIVNTVIHEIFHSSVWVKNHVPFNESAAHFVGLQGAIDFARFQLNTCTEELCRTKWQDLLETAEKQKSSSFRFAQLISNLYRDLYALYTSALTSEEKLEQRGDIFAQYFRQLDEIRPERQTLKVPNNAEIMQLRIYMIQLGDFERVLERCERSWPCFSDTMRAIDSWVSEERQRDPFQRLHQIAQGEAPVALTPSPLHPTSSEQSPQERDL